MEFACSVDFQRSLNRVLNLKHVEEILFGLRDLAKAQFQRTSAYRRFAYESIRHTSECKKMMNEDIYKLIDKGARHIFYNRASVAIKNKEQITIPMGLVLNGNN